jgi:hypothetical protein
VSRKVQKAFEDAYRQVVAAYMAASAKLRAGNRLVQFPEGTFPPALAFVKPGSLARAG